MKNAFHSPLFFWICNLVAVTLCVIEDIRKKLNALCLLKAICHRHVLQTEQITPLFIPQTYQCSHSLYMFNDSDFALDQ